MDILDDFGLEYETEMCWYQCRDQRALPFDFYVPKYNLVIEVDGIQHFEPQKHFGGEEGFKLQKYHDDIKEKYCRKEGIEMIRVPYFMDTRIAMKSLIARELRNALDYKYYANTEGCYIISDYYNLAVAHKCNIEDPDSVNIDGEDLFVRYAEGDMKLLLSFCTDKVRYIIFERNDSGELKYYDFEKFKSRVLRNT